MNKIIIRIKDFINKVTVKIGANKMHVICSLIITLIVGFIFSPLFGIFVGGVVGLTKELYDELIYRKYSKGIGFDKSDLIYDSIGIVIATIILLI